MAIEQINRVPRIRQAATTEFTELNIRRRVMKHSRALLNFKKALEDTVGHVPGFQAMDGSISLGLVDSTELEPLFSHPRAGFLLPKLVDEFVEARQRTARKEKELRFVDSFALEVGLAKAGIVELPSGVSILGYYVKDTPKFKVEGSMQVHEGQFSLERNWATSWVSEKTGLTIERDEEYKPFVEQARWISGQISDGLMDQMIGTLNKLDTELVSIELFEPEMRLWPDSVAGKNSWNNY